jgi:hypothetical protein
LGLYDTPLIRIDRACAGRRVGRELPFAATKSTQMPRCTDTAGLRRIVRIFTYELQSIEIYLYYNHASAVSLCDQTVQLPLSTGNAAASLRGRGAWASATWIRQMWKACGLPPRNAAPQAYERVTQTLSNTTISPLALARQSHFTFELCATCLPAQIAVCYVSFVTSISPVTMLRLSD